MRSLSLEERPGAALALAADENLGRAIVDAPAEMSGLGEGLANVYETVTQQYRQTYIQKHHGEKLRELNDADADYQAGEQMVNAVRTELLKASGLTQQGFGTLLSPIEAEIDKAA